MTSSTPRDWIATYDPADPALQAAIRRRKTRFYWVFIPVFVVVFVAVRWFQESDAQFASTGLDRILARTPAWLVGVTFMVAIVLMVAAMVVSLRPSNYALVQRNPRLVLTRAESRRVGRQIRGREPVAAHEVPFLRDVARAMHVGRWAVLSMAGVLLLVVGGTMLGDDNGVPVPSAIALVPILIGVYSVRNAVLGRRFLKSVRTTPV